MRPRSVRQRIVLTILLVTVAAVVAFGVPLAAGVDHMQRARAVLRLERQATRVLALVPDEALVAGQPLLLPPSFVPADERGRLLVGIYDNHGRRLSGAGPVYSGAAAVGAVRGREEVREEAGQLAVAIPVRSDQPSTTMVRAAEPLSALAGADRFDYLVLAGLALGAVVLAGAVGWWQARRLAAPMDALTDRARALGQGDFTITASPSGLREVDEASEALQTTAGRLGRLLQRERAFSADASHQLRTPLTALRLTLETAPLTPGARLPDVCAEAVTQIDRLEETIDRLLSVARDVEPVDTVVDLPAVLTDTEARWRPLVQAAGRRLVVGPVDGIPPVRASDAGLRHVLDVLLDNALRHGAGTVTVGVLAAGPGVSIEVTDEGPGPSGDPDRIFDRRVGSAHGHGIGLALARALVEADGGRLLLRQPGPHPVFAVVLPPDRPGSGS